MTLQAGTKLASYDVTALIGQGGRRPALELAERSPATANSYENAPATRFPRGSEVACPCAPAIASVSTKEAPL